MEDHEFNDQLIEAKMHLQRNPLDKYWLINEAFVLWYPLVEDMSLENFEEQEMHKMLRANYRKFKEHFNTDGDYSFILGWMMYIAPWYLITGPISESETRLLMAAYKTNPKNALFKWAISHELNCTSKEIENLKIDIQSRFHFYYDYGKLIENYFTSGI